MKKMIAIAGLSFMALTAHAEDSEKVFGCNMGEIKDGSFIEMNIKTVPVSSDEVSIEYVEGEVANTTALSAYATYNRGQMMAGFLLSPKSGEPYEVLTLSDSYANLIVSHDDRMFRIDCQVNWRAIPSEEGLEETETGSILEGIARP